MLWKTRKGVNDNNKSGKRETAEGIEQPNEKTIRTLGEKENYNYLEILEDEGKDKTRIAQKNEKAS